MNGNDLKADLNGILDTVYIRTIIEAAREPKSVPEISAEYEIPIGTMCRRAYKPCNCNIL